MADNKAAGRGPRQPAPLPESAGEPDPQGVAPADQAAQDEPKGRPNSDRHLMETAIARQQPAPKK